MTRKPKTGRQISRESDRDDLRKMVGKLQKRLADIASEISSIHLPDTTKESALMQEASVLDRLVGKGQGRIDVLQAEIDRLDARRGKDEAPGV